MAMYDSDNSFSSSCSSSDYFDECELEDEQDKSRNASECINAGGNVCRGLQPYMFEPRVTGEASHRPTPQEDHRNRTPDSIDWCVCACCCPMEDPVNRQCCQENERYVERMKAGAAEVGKEVQCITQHPNFEAVCLNRDVLRVAYFTMRQHKEADHHHTEHETLRYTAYRQLVRWCHGWLGKYNRVPLPACAMKIIRREFPSQTGEYTGFKFVDRM